ncbi:MAG: 1,4-alpha-glucan branching protein domain-containing protein [Candidatus Gastranaerophilales bacterium]
MSVGQFVFMLHSHLPYYRKAGMWPFGEENLYECMAETYIPLLNAISELYDEGIKAKLTVGITPILAEQLDDEHLKQGFIDYIDSRIEQVSGDLERYPDEKVAHSQHLKYLAKYYFDWFNHVKDCFINKYDKDLIGQFRKYQELGCIEITTSGATHGFSPLLATDSNLNAQFKIGSDTTQRLFGKKAMGAWLPECAYRQGYEYVGQDGEKKWRPAIEVTLQNNDIEYFFTESHVIEGGNSIGNRRVIGVYGNIEYIPLPEREATGCDTYSAYWLPDAQVAVMGRNERAGYQVWSAADGYPGAGCFREFHKKDANSGMHYWRITSEKTDLGDKMLYDPVLALNKINENSDHYTNLIYHMLNDYKKANNGKEGLVMVSFDTELFGHWWFEGVEFIKQVIRKFSAFHSEVERMTAGEYVRTNPPKEALQIPESSWGQGGHFYVWNNHLTEWMWPIIHSCEKRMNRIVDANAEIPEDKLLLRALKQLARENLLLQSSDWPFLITTWQAKDYATDRFREHVERFEQIADMIENSSINEAELFEIENIDNCFPTIDYRVYQSIEEGVIPQQSKKLAPLYE